MKQLHLYLIVIVFAGFFCAPFYLGIMNLRLMTEVLYYSLFTLSLCLITGFGGKVSFGHAAYFSVGAYTTALVLLHLQGFGLIATLVISGLAAGCVGAFFGIFLVRVSGTYFAMLTMAFGQLVYAVTLKWRSVTGGDDGLGGFSIPPLEIPLIGPIDMLETSHFYWFTLFVVGLLYLAVWHLTRTSFGVSILLLRENEERAKFQGHNTSVIRFVMFTISATLAGFAGGLFAMFQEFVATTSADIVKSTEGMLMMMIGGMNHLAGPLLGSMFYVFVGDWLSNLTDTWEFYIGVIFIAMMLFMRGGLVSLAQGIWVGLKLIYDKKGIGNIKAIFESRHKGVNT